MDKETVIYRYKYLPFTEGSLKMITDGTLKFTCPIEFNDPFDCMPCYSMESIENIYKNRPDLIKRLGITPGRWAREKGKYITKIKKVVESGEYVKALAATLGVVSLSRDPANILMWSHYADHHEGFVVELRLSVDSPGIEDVMPIPVSYKDERPSLDWGAAHTDIEGYFLTKSSHWSYEQEERIVTTNEGPGIHPYSREEFLCSVIAGCRVSQNIHRLRAALREASAAIGREIPLYEAKLSRDKYEIHIPDHPRAELFKRQQPISPSRPEITS